MCKAGAKGAPATPQNLPKPKEIPSSNVGGSHPKIATRLVLANAKTTREDLETMEHDARRNPAEPMPPPVKEPPPDGPENPDLPIREPDPADPGEI
jgi:hypothetical protein